MSDKILKIEITFPCPVDIPSDWYAKLAKLLHTVCLHYEKRHKDRVMWVGTSGYKMLDSNDEYIQLDDSVYTIDLFERRRFARLPTLGGEDE